MLQWHWHCDSIPMNQMTNANANRTHTAQLCDDKKDDCKNTTQKLSILHALIINCLLIQITKWHWNNAKFLYSSGEFVFDLGTKSYFAQNKSIFYPTPIVRTVTFFYYSQSCGSVVDRNRWIVSCWAHKLDVHVCRLLASTICELIWKSIWMKWIFPRATKITIQ